MTTTTLPPNAVEAVDALVSRLPDLPPPAVRARLRRAGKLTQPEVAEALGVHRVQVARWESGRCEPRKPHRALYAHLLRQLAERHPHAAAEEAAVT